MAITFVQVPVIIRSNKEALAGVYDVLELINSDNPNNIYKIDTSFHVGSIAEADTVETGLNTLKELGVLDVGQWTNTISLVDGFRRNYLQ